jgi:HEAT repeat protein
MRKLTILTLAVAVSLFAVSRAPATEKEDLSADELRLQSLGLSTDAADLLDFFRKRSLAQVPTATLDELIKGLGSRDTEVRKKAVRDLIGYGALAVPALRVALSDPDDTLVYEGARRCLRVLTGEEAPRVAASAARVLAAARPKGAIEVLMGYLLNADNEDVTEAVKSALTMLAFASGKADPVLIKALEDPSPLKRATAIDVLCSSGQAEPRATLRKLLSDPKPSVRLRAALALARVKDARAVSTLIVLLPEAPFKIARQAEEFLNELAGDQAPKVTLTEEQTSRVKVREAWAEWWIKTEAPGLLDELKKRTMTDAARNEVVELIKNLGSDIFKVRESAEKKLKDKGVLVVPLLKQAAKNDPDPEVRERAARCLVDIEKSQVGPLSPVIPR